MSYFFVMDDTSIRKNHVIKFVVFLVKGSSMCKSMWSQDHPYSKKKKYIYTHTLAIKNYCKLTYFDPSDLIITRI